MITVKCFLLNAGTIDEKLKFEFHVPAKQPERKELLNKVTKWRFVANTFEDVFADRVCIVAIGVKNAENVLFRLRRLIRKLKKRSCRLRDENLASVNRFAKLVKRFGCDFENNL